MIKKYVLFYMYSICNFCPILMKLEFSQQIFEKYSSIKFNKNTFSGSRRVLHGQTYKHDDANSRFSQFCESI
jgi:hypothetical protein